MINQRIDFPDRAKAYGILFVMLGHVFFIAPQSLISDYIKFLGTFVYSFHMPMFFVIAGMFFQSSLGEVPLFSAVKKIVTRTVIPFIAVNLLYWGAYLADKAVFGMPEYYAGGDVYGFGIVLLGGTWFIAALFIVQSFNLIISRIWQAAVGPDRLGLLTSILMVAGYCVMLIPRPASFAIFPLNFDIHYFFFWYALGRAWALFFPPNGSPATSSAELQLSLAKPGLRLTLATFCGLVVVDTLRYLLHLRGEMLFSSMGLIVFVFVASTLKLPKFDAQLRKMGQLSMRIYVIHFFVIDFCMQNVYVHFIKGHGIRSSYYFPFVFISTVLIAIPIAWINYPSWMRFLVFGESSRRSVDLPSTVPSNAVVQPA